MLRGETEEVQRRLRRPCGRSTARRKSAALSLLRHDLRGDTGSQDALEKLLQEPLDLLL